VHLSNLAGVVGAAADADYRLVPVRRGRAEGLTPEEFFACAIGARRGLGEVIYRLSDVAAELHEAALPRGFGVLARAMRAKSPGVVFANAAACGEVDPLGDLDARPFVGLGPKG
jgi:hypothetical protein